MNKKNNLFSKLNLNTKNINIELEKILDEKNFSEDVQSLILSMFYKIENAYSDYYIAKRQMPTKEVYIETIVNAIKENCNSIEIIKGNEQRNRTINSVKINDGKIRCIQNEDILLLGIFELIIKENKTEDLIENIFSELLNRGNCLNSQEVIRAFNGWSWQDNLNNLNDIYINLVYQNLLILLGNENMKEIIQSSNKISKLQDIIKKIYSKEYARELINSIMEIFISLKINSQKKLMVEVENYFEPLNNELIKLENKEELVKYIADKRKEITKKIGEIDKKINNIEFLKEDFKDKNKNIKNDKKIFSISNLVDLYEEERQNLLENMKEYNRLVEPNFYLQKKEELTNKVEVYKKIDLQSNKKINIDKILINMQEIFLKCFEEKIKKCENKKDIVDLIYIYRYYLNLNYNKDYRINNCTKIKKKLDNVLQVLINRAEELKAIDIFSSDIESNLEIIKNVLTNQIINLENEILQINSLDEEKNLYNVKYYDGVTFVKEIELELENVLNKKKKLRIFI